MLRNKLLVVDYQTTPLGHLWQAAEQQDSLAVLRDERHLYGSYALVMVLRGRAEYSDPNHPSLTLTPGSVVLVTPDLPHRYGPAAGHTYDQVYIAFKGPIFGLWRAQGLLDPSNPVWQVQPVPVWKKRFLESMCIDDPSTEHTRLKRVLRVQQLLLDLRPSDPTAAERATGSNWLLQACEAIDQLPIDESPDWAALAEHLGMSYHSFRKRFRAMAGQTPGQYRARHTMDLASGMLLDPTLSVADVSDRLGFCNEFHFSTRFKAVTGVSPSSFRRQRFHAGPDVR